MENKVKTRSSNIELLRIFAVFLIISYHIFRHCILHQLTDLDSIEHLQNNLFNQPVISRKLILLAVVSPLGKVGNVIFIMISGFFLASKKRINLINTSKKLLFQQGFVAIVLTVGTTIIYKLFGLSDLHMYDINVFNNLSWFPGYYFLVVLIADLFINRYIQKASRTEYKQLLLILLALTQFPWIVTLAERLATGVSVVLTGLFVYVLGGYIREYGLLNQIKTGTIILLLFIIAGFILLSNYNHSIQVINEYLISTQEEEFIWSFVGYSDNYIIPIVIGTLLFELFRRISLPEIKIVNYLGSATFVIYLLHDNTFFYKVWRKKDWVSLLYNTPAKFALYYILWIMLVFVIGVLAYILYDVLTKVVTRFRGRLVND